MEDSSGACPECAEVWKECTCAESPSCWICLESSGKLLRGCACRGTAGYVHAACLVEANRHRTDAHDKCPTCKTRFVGALSMAAAEARVRGARASRSNSDCAATCEFARACVEQGRHAEALQHYRNVLRQQLEHHGPDQLETAQIRETIAIARTTQGIANVQQSMGKYNEALKNHQKVLAINEAVFGPDHLDTAKTRENIANVYREQGKHAEALELYMQVLAVEEKVLGLEHPLVADTNLNMGAAYDEMGDNEKAMECYNRALPIYERVHGLDHPLVADTQNNIAIVFRQHGKYPEALEMYEKALKTRVAVLGPEHPLVAKTYNK